MPRLLPPTKLVKSEEHGPGFSSYDVVTVFDDMKLGHIFRLVDQPSWTACQVVDHPQYGTGTKVVGYRRIRSEAVELVVHAWMANIDEIAAHKINDALINGVRDAHDRAEVCRQEDDSRPLTYEDGGKLDSSNWSLTDSCDVFEHDLKNILVGKASFFNFSPESIYKLANRLHFMQLELQRRKRQSQYSMIPSGDYRENEPINWTIRARRLAEELGRAEANMVNEEGTFYRHLDDLDVRDHTRNAHNRLSEAQANTTSYISDIQRRATNYQALLNESHRRALLMAEQKD